MVLLESLQIPLGSSPHDFSLSGVDGKKYGLASAKESDILVIVFMCNHCPYIQACIERLVRLSNDFQNRGVYFIGINSNDGEQYPEDNFEAMKEFAAEHDIQFPYLHDESQEVARAYNAQCTPDIFVYDKDRKLAYHGRIDDNWKDSDKVTSQDLRNALEALLNGKPVSEDQHPSMGCSIKWRE